MRKHLGSVLAVAGLIAAPAIAQAQARGAMAMGGMPSHEFGVDLTAFYSHFGNCTGNCSTLTLGTPVDVRIGFVSSGPLSFEPRFSLAFFAVTGSGGGHVLTLTPGLNVLYKMGPGTGRHNMMGTYLTGGLALKVADVTGGSPPAQFSVNVGVGSRMAFGSGAFRPEGFFRYNFKASNSTSTLNSSYDIGVRLGLSLWH